MWQFKEKTCPKCGIDLTGVEPQRIGGEERHPYSVCPNCGRICPVIEVDSETEPEPAAEPVAEAPETPEVEPTEPSEPAAEPVAEAPETPEVEPTEPSEPAAEPA